MALPTRWLALAWLVASPAAARWTAVPGSPWTESVTGTETGDAIGVDLQGYVWLVGTATSTLYAGVDADLTVYSTSVTGQPVGHWPLGFAGWTVGRTALALHERFFGGAATGSEPDGFIAFTITGGGFQPIGLWELRMNGGSIAMDTVTYFIDGDFADQELGGVAVTGGVTPYVCGAERALGVDQLYYGRTPSMPCSGLCYQQRVTATYWTGSLTQSVTGRAVGADPDGNAWIAAQSAGDLVLFRYTPAAYAGSGPNDLRATLAPGYPRPLATPERDEPFAGAVDGDRSFWVAGAIDADAAVWKFDVNGNPVAGFPKRWTRGQPAVLRGLAVDGNRNCFVAGSTGPDLLLLGYDRTGALLPGFPIIETAAPDLLSAGGVATDRADSVYVAATVTAAPASWGGTVRRFYQYAYVPEPLPIAAGQVRIRGPEGELLNVLRGEVLTVLAVPREGGSLTFQVLTLRGEPVREFRTVAAAEQLSTFTWDGRNAAGQLVASGTYAARVAGAGLSVIRRVVVVRRP